MEIHPWSHQVTVTSDCGCPAALRRRAEGHGAGWEKGWAMQLALLCTSGQRSWTGNPAPYLERSAGRELKGMQSNFSIILQFIGWHCPALAIRFGFYSFIRHFCATPGVLHPCVCVSPARLRKKCSEVVCAGLVLQGWFIFCAVNSLGQGMS